MGARGWGSLVLAVATGLIAAAVDLQPRFDDIGVLAFGILAGAALAAGVAGRRSLGWLLLLVGAAGMPVPVAELARGGSAAAFAATAFAAIGVGIGSAAARLGSQRPDLVA